MTITDMAAVPETVTIKPFWTHLVTLHERGRIPTQELLSSRVVGRGSLPKYGDRECYKCYDFER
jgi:hypothetical protein